MINNSAVANLIREGKTHQIASVMQTGYQFGMVTFERAVDQLIREGKISQADGDNFLGRKSIKTNTAPEQPQYQSTGVMKGFGKKVG